MPATGAAFLSPDLTAAEIVEKSGYSSRSRPSRSTSGDDRRATARRWPRAMPRPPIRSARAGPAPFFGLNADRVIFEDTQTFKGNMPESGAPGHGDGSEVN